VVDSSSGKVTPLIMTPYQVSYGGYSAGIVQGTGADWFGPLNPMSPTAPPEVRGRQFDFPSGFNLIQVPRAYDAISFGEMRGLADSYDILRLVIETRKDQMEKLEWTIKPKVSSSGKVKAQVSDKVVDEITAFFERPDGVNDWGTWLRSLLEDLFVIDAPTLYCHETLGGQLLGLEQIDGATVKRVIDDWGRTPKDPIPAYQQVLKGMPAVNYTNEEMIYLPRNVRAHKVYGFSPVEQVIMTVNIGLRRQLFQLQYYTEGNIPEALVGTPDLWTPSQIQQFQDAFDAMLAGNTANRRKIKFVPGGVAKTFVPTKEVQLTNETDEWLARVVCFCFSISPQPFTKQMNRATAATAQEAALEEGLAPVMNWVKRLVNRVIQKYWPNSGLVFDWLEEEEVDQTAQADQLVKYVDSGVYTANEAREMLGQSPMPEGSKLRIKTGAGAVPLDQAEKNAEIAAQIATAGAQRPKDESQVGSGGKEEEGSQAPVKTGGAAEKAAGTFRKGRDFYANDSSHRGCDHG
jgi:HK97 family phage portal protein